MGCHTISGQKTTARDQLRWPFSVSLRRGGKFLALMSFESSDRKNRGRSDFRASAPNLDAPRSCKRERQELPEVGNVPLDLLGCRSSTLRCSNFVSASSLAASSCSSLCLSEKIRAIFSDVTQWKVPRRIDVVRQSRLHVPGGGAGRTLPQTPRPLSRNLLPTLAGFCTLGARSLIASCTPSNSSLEIRAGHAPSTLTGSWAFSPLLVLPHTAVPA